MNFAKRLRQFRHSRNMTQDEFAQFLAVSLGTVRSWEQGLSTPSLKNKAKIESMGFRRHWFDR